MDRGPTNSYFRKLERRNPGIIWARPVREDIKNNVKPNQVDVDGFFNVYGMVDTEYYVDISVL